MENSVTTFQEVIDIARVTQDNILLDSNLCLIDIVAAPKLGELDGVVVVAQRHVEVRVRGAPAPPRDLV